MSLTPARSEALALFGQEGAFCKGLKALAGRGVRRTGEAGGDETVEKQSALLLSEVTC